MAGVRRGWVYASKGSVTARSRVYPSWASTRCSTQDRVAQRIEIDEGVLAPRPAAMAIEASDWPASL